MREVDRNSLQYKLEDPIGFTKHSIWIMVAKCGRTELEAIDAHLERESDPELLQYLRDRRIKALKDEGRRAL
jgi:hypothetical protein